MGVIDKKLLSILVCPVSKAPLEYDKDKLDEWLKQKCFAH